MRSAHVYSVVSGRGASCRAGGAVALLCAIACLFLAGGCVSPAARQADNAVADYLMGDYRAAETRLAPLAQNTNEDFVLNNARLGASALAAGDLDKAESAFLRGYEVINSVGVNDGGRSLGAAVVAERIKVWKGEPFERAMLNFYLGLVYYIRHDYNNARAAFENSLFKLRDYGEGTNKTDAYQEQESNFALAYVMLGRCYQRVGRPDAANKAFDRAVELKSFLAPLVDAARNQRTNVLLVIDYGHGPTKLANGDGAFVGFYPTPREEPPLPAPVIIVDGQAMDMNHVARPSVDLLALAQDRRWQDIDTIRAIKTSLGTGLIVGGAAYGLADRHANPYVALGLIAGGVLLKASSQADLRHWEMLPRTTFVIPLELPPGKHDITIDFPEAGGVRQEWHGIDAPPTGDATYYARIERFRYGYAEP